MRVYRPPKFQGDLRRFDGGVFSFDYRCDNDFLVGGNLYVVIGGSLGFFQWIANGRNLNGWTRVSIGLTYDTLLGSIFDQQQWKQFLSNVTHLSIQASDGTIPEGTDLDNVRLLGTASVVPEPGPLTLWCSFGFLALCLRRRRRFD